MNAKVLTETVPCYRIPILAIAVLFAMSLTAGRAKTNSGGPNASPQATVEQHDGQHDFDFEFGHWKIHLKRLQHPLTGSDNWIEFDGTSVTRKVWDGRSQLEKFETEGAGGHIEDLTLRTYNAQTRQWSLYWVNGKDGVVTPPKSASSRMESASFMARTHQTVKLSMFPLFCRRPIPICLPLNSHSLMMGARLGK